MNPIIITKMITFSRSITLFKIMFYILECAYRQHKWSNICIIPLSPIFPPYSSASIIITAAGNFYIPFTGVKNLQRLNQDQLSKRFVIQREDHEFQHIIVISGSFTLKKTCCFWKGWIFEGNYANEGNDAHENKVNVEITSWTLVDLFFARKSCWECKH